MDVEFVTQQLKQRLPLARFQHVLRVTETAKMLAERYGVSIVKAEQAALFHDIAKFTDSDELRQVLVKEKEDPRLLSFHHELWHGPVGATIARDEFAIEDTDILNAIRYHTTGRANMTFLEKLIYVADMIEPGRNFPGVEELRRTTEKSLDSAMEACIYHSVQFLVLKKVPVFPDSIDCYNEYLMKK
ncbi:bis(5'-nucleosyl)-tetraphosphatase (symmetrical) YqeK [Filibacter tadaridae]|uniref:bis(5'-nucleosyl)-tetraphosphatase (symmetrical) n=1 Tax=Filibacter tadaridae TaxID=2483811 RepID=A0A3P5XWM7_9BACL|nr:bis(5'-nucleosyl)-tetraphosphatase (symmetrical) YqeK [Filibacter tadaridae]VDC32549.1 putative nicotinate-nucleotide adenylyltransferase [Filibacter tadaridae]